MKKIFTLAGALMLSVAAAAAFLNWGTSEGSDDFSFSLVRIVATSKATGSVLAFGEGTTIVGLDLGSRVSSSGFYQLTELDGDDLTAITADNKLNFFFEFYVVSSQDVLQTTGYSDIISYEEFLGSIASQASQDLTRLMVKAHVAPEPSSALLLVVGGALLGLRRRRRA